jgi:RND family efflux transporter MFP subunit
VAPGDQPEKGDLLAELHAPQVEEEAAQAELELESVEVDLDLLELEQEQLEAVESPPSVMVELVGLRQAEAALEQAKEDYQYAVQASQPPTITNPLERAITVKEYEYWLASARYSEAKRTLATEQAIKELKIEQARQKVERARERSRAASEKLSDTQLVAPFSGVVVSVDKSVGDQVGSYETIGVIADPSQLSVIATVLNEDLRQVTVGRAATVQFDAYPDEEYAGTVLRIASQPVVLQGEAAYEVTIGFDEGQDVPASIGMGGGVTIVGESREDILLVPARAIITIGDLRYVEVVREDGEIERVEIETGLSSGSETEVTAGLEEGDEVRMP